MTSITTTPKPRRRRSRSRIGSGALVALAVVALAGAAGGGIWQVTAHRAVTHPQAASEPAISAPVRPAPAERESAGLTVFLVGSADQAVFVQEILAAAGSLPFVDAALPSLVVNTAVPEGRAFAQALAAGDMSVRGDGRPGVTLVDLQTGAVASSVTRLPTTRTVYLVRTPEQERILRAWLAQGSFGVPGGAPANAAVIRAPSAEEAAFAYAALLEWRRPSGDTPAVVNVQTSP